MDALSEPQALITQEAAYVVRFDQALRIGKIASPVAGAIVELGNLETLQWFRDERVWFEPIEDEL